MEADMGARSLHLPAACSALHGDGKAAKAIAQAFGTNPLTGTSTFAKSADGVNLHTTNHPSSRAAL